MTLYTDTNLMSQGYLRNMCSKITPGGRGASGGELRKTSTPNVALHCDGLWTQTPRTYFKTSTTQLPRALFAYHMLAANFGQCLANVGATVINTGRIWPKLVERFPALDHIGTHWRNYDRSWRPTHTNYAQNTPGSMC